MSELTTLQAQGWVVVYMNGSAKRGWGVDASRVWGLVWEGTRPQPRGTCSGLRAAEYKSGRTEAVLHVILSAWASG